MNSISDKILCKLLENNISGGQDAEYRAWQNSLNFMKNVLDDRDIDDDIRVAIEYQLAVKSLDTISVKVSNGKTDLTGKFSTDYDNSTKTIIVTLVDKNEFYGGYYAIKFYKNGELFVHYFLF